MHHPRIALLVSMLAATAIAPRPAAADLPPLTTLAPGTDLRIQQTVDVNVVLIGFGALIPNPAALTSMSPMPTWNGVPANSTGVFIGQRFDFNYHFFVATPQLENLLFGFLRAIAAPQ